MLKREIRVWDSQNNIMWVPDEEIITLYDVLSISELEDATLLVSIGLEDKNNQPIFEHDVVKWKKEYRYGYDTKIYFVLYNPKICRYVLSPIECLFEYQQGKLPETFHYIAEEDCPSLEVIGDIYHVIREESMPKESLTEIVVVLDKSGSMDSIKQDAIGGFNSFLKAQKELPGDALFTLVLFDTEYDMIYNGTPINLVQELNEQTYIPGGCTALLDAIGRTIALVHERLSSTAETQRPSKVIFAILTDGQENSSKEYNRSIILDKITRNKEQNNWEFIFLAANQDAIAEGGSLGIGASHSYNFVADSNGANLAMNTLTCAVTSFRAGEDIDLSNAGDENE